MQVHIKSGLALMISSESSAPPECLHPCNDLRSEPPHLPVHSGPHPAIHNHRYTNSFQAVWSMSSCLSLATQAASDVLETFWNLMVCVLLLCIYIYTHLQYTCVYIYKYISFIYPSKIEHQIHSTKFCRPIFPTYHGLAGTLHKSLPQSESTTSLKSFCLCHFWFKKTAPPKSWPVSTFICSNFKKGTSFVLVAKARSDSHTSLGSLPRLGPLIWSYHQLQEEVLNSWDQGRSVVQWKAARLSTSGIDFRWNKPFLDCTDLLCSAGLRITNTYNANTCFKPEGSVTGKATFPPQNLWRKLESWHFGWIGQGFFKRKHTHFAWIWLGQGFASWGLFSRMEHGLWRCGNLCSQSKLDLQVTTNTCTMQYLRYHLFYSPFDFDHTVLSGNLLKLPSPLSTAPSSLACHLQLPLQRSLVLVVQDAPNWWRKWVMIIMIMTFCTLALRISCTWCSQRISLERNGPRNWPESKNADGLGSGNL